MRRNETAPPPPAPLPWRHTTVVDGVTTTYTYFCNGIDGTGVEPAHGAASTKTSSGFQICPFDKDSTVCTTSSCYFYHPTTGDARVCPVIACDTLIKSYCDDLKTKSTQDLGCQVFTRPLIYDVSVVGIGPYVDWLESSITSTNTTQTPVVNIVNPGMKGGTSSFVLEFLLETSDFTTYKSAFIADAASKLGISANFLYVTGITTSGEDTAVQMQVVGKSTGTLLASGGNGCIKVRRHPCPHRREISFAIICDSYQSLLCDGSRRGSRYLVPSVRMCCGPVRQ